MGKLVYLGKELESHWLDSGVADISELNEVRTNYYKTTKQQALKQLNKILTDGGVKQDKIFKYYFEKIANDTLVDFSKWTINEMLASDELLSLFINKSKSNDKVFTSSDLTNNVRTAIRLGGKGYARPVTQFPLKENKRFINITGKIIGDMASGWGTRMIAAASTGNNYVGFEVNPPLIEKLNELGHDIQSILPNFKFKIIAHGSEILYNELVGHVSQIITSPPYFDLESYTQNGDEVYAGTYNAFRDKFLYPMTENALKYLKNGGELYINIKDSKKASSMTDLKQYAKSHNLNTKLGSLKNISRTLSNGSHLNGDEDVLIIKK